MSRLLCLIAAVLALILPGAELIGSGSGSGSGSGTGPPLVPLSSVASLTQQQRNNIVYIQFSGITITAQQFVDNYASLFQQAIANIYNLEAQRSGKQATLIRPEDVTILDSPTVMNGVLTVAFVVGGKGGQSLPISNTELEAILQREGSALASAMSIATGTNFEFVGVMAGSQTQPALSQTVVIGIVIGVVVAVVLIAILMIAVAVYSFVRTIRKKRQAKTTGSYVEVSAGDDNNFSSNWTPMKVNARGDYEAVPKTFNGEGKRDTNTAL